MNFFENVLIKTSGSAFGLLNHLLFSISQFHWVWFVTAGLVAATCLIAGSRFKRFNHPDHPLLSSMVRGIAGKAATWTGGSILSGFALLAFAITGLTLLGATVQAALQKLNQWAVILHYFELLWPHIKPPLYAFLAGVGAGLVLSVYLVVRAIPLLERGEGLRDVRHMQKNFRRMRQFTPLNFINLKKGIFIGLEDGKHPVHVPLQQLHETHVQILGASGGGKGIALGVLGYQFIIAGESTIMFDPKGDKRLPVVLAAAASRAKVRFHHLDLNPTAPPQFNLLAGAQAHEIEELLVGGLGLEPSGGEGNYYRGIDQDAAERVASQASVGRDNMPALLEIAQADENFHKADNFVRRLKQVCDLPAIQTSHDIDLPGILARGEVLYIRGSTDNHRVKALQTMLLIRLLQIIKARGECERKVALILDEFKHLLCQVSLDALGTVRELGCHAILAHQSLGDLGAAPGLRREDVEPRVVDNTSIKLIFRINDEKASAGFAAKSGKQRTHTEAVRGVDEDGHDQRGWNETQQFRMSEDLFTHLHRPSDGTEVVAAGVLFGYKSARLLAVSPINAKGTIPPVKAAPADTVVVVKTPEALI